MVIPRFVRQALAGEAITVYGDGTQKRCFCNVRDVVTAVLGLLDSPRAVGQVYNVGSQEEVSIRELAERVRSAAGSDSRIVNVPYDQAYEQGFEDMQRRVPDISKIRMLTGWEPRILLDETLREVIAYCRATPASPADEI
jgi:UDP-glucose 4-epimerase